MAHKFLSDREWKTVEAFADVFVEGAGEAITPAQIADNIDRQLDAMRTNRKNSVRLVLFAIEYVLPILSLSRPFSRMRRDARRTLIEKHLASPNATGLLRQLSRIKTLFLAGYYGDLRVQATLPFVAVQDRARNRPPHPPLAPLGLDPIPVQPPDRGETEITADVCVIGSGAGGAVVAALAAQAGRRVVLVEEGPYVRGPDLRHDEAAMAALLYKEGGLQSTVDLKMSILQGKCLGGTTVINNLICYRIDDPHLNPGTNASLLEDWAALGAHIDRDKLNAAYDRVETRLDVRQIPQEIAGAGATVLFDGWKALVDAGVGNPVFRSGLFRKNMNRCAGCGYCNFGCPYERKLSMLETYVADAAAAGARIITDCHATKVRREGGAATGVECDVTVDGATRPLFVRASQVVVAAGAIGSSVLLMKSGIKRNVGRAFSFNAATPVAARFPHTLNAWDAVQMAAYVHGGDFILETLFNPPMGFAVTLPGWFETHFQRMQAYDRFTSAGVMVGTEPTARVKGSDFFRRLIGPIEYSMSDGDLAKMRNGMSLLAAIYFAAGAEAVYPSTFVDLEMTRERFVRQGTPDLSAISAFLDGRIKDSGDLTLNSSHPQGGNAISDNPKVGVISSRFEAHECANLFVTDASVFPTTLAVNPQLTIMAMADYAWHHAMA